MGCVQTFPNVFFAASGKPPFLKTKEVGSATEKPVVLRPTAALRSAQSGKPDAVAQMGCCTFCPTQQWHAPDSLPPVASMKGRLSGRCSPVMPAVGCSETQNPPDKSMTLCISIRYQLRSEVTARELQISPEMYFDPLGSHETYEKDGIPRFDHAKDYLEHPAIDLAWTDLRVSGAAPDFCVHTQFLPDGQSFLCHRQDEDGHEEIINCTQQDPATCHILRVHKNPGQGWNINYNACIRNLADGSQQEIRFDT